MAALRMADAEMDIRAYTKYNETEILDLYASVGWTAYTDSSYSPVLFDKLVQANTSSPKNSGR